MIKRIRIFSASLLFLTATITGFAQAPDFRNADQPANLRVQDLLSKLTLEEKISLLGFRSQAVPRLGIPAYNWWNEALHGVARAGQATVFPQAIALAATFNDSLIHQIGDAISTEARAKYNLSTAAGNRRQYMGLTFWSPNINIFRDPRWGRGQETYGEDPFLTATIGSAYVQGMQGNDPHYLKTAACAKHFAVHSGPEATRHTFNAVVDEKDLRETYLYAFKRLVDAHVESVMCAYNRLNDQPCCTNDGLLRRILRQEWGFKGHIVTDCWALKDIWDMHKVMPNSVAVAAAALNTGVNLDCSDMLQADAMKAVEQGLVSRATIDSALAALLRTQFRLGFYDDAARVPFSRLGSADIHSAKNTGLARQAAQQSMVLLKNDRHILPLNSDRYSSIMIIGPNAGSIDPLLGNYRGMSGELVTFAAGITEAAGPTVSVQYDQGCDYSDTVHFGGIWAAGESDISIAIIGLTPSLEGEEGDAFLAANGGDRQSLSLPAPHIKLLKELHKKGKPVIAVVTAGSAVDIAAIEPYADAVLLAWYPGEQGGRALADILFGKVSPSGRLPVTIYKSLADLPAYDNYHMQGRTYRYFDGPVQYPFGYGLSYTTFDYSWAAKPAPVLSLKDTLHCSVTIRNTGSIDAAEVAQLYVAYPGVARMPVQELKGFRRITIPHGDSRTVSFSIPASELQKWDMNQHRWTLYPGTYTIMAGAGSRDIRLKTIVRINR